MVKRKKVLIAFVMLLVVGTSNMVVSAADCYENWYMSSNCSKCDDSMYNTSQRDGCIGKHARQNGINLCSTHLRGISTQATYYKRGFSDYNCLAYALGNNGVQSWTWPTSWGSNGPTLSTFKSYIAKKGYSYTSNENSASGKDIIYVYSKNGYIRHFARKYTLDGKSVSGAATISKWGGCCLYKTTSTNPYTSSSEYGSLILICYK